MRKSFEKSGSRTWNKRRVEKNEENWRNIINELQRVAIMEYCARLWSGFQILWHFVWNHWHRAPLRGWFNRELMGHSSKTARHYTVGCEVEPTKWSFNCWTSMVPALQNNREIGFRVNSSRVPSSLGAQIPPKLRNRFTFWSIVQVISLPQW